MKKILVMVLAFGLVRASFAQNISRHLDSVMTAYFVNQKFNGAVLVAKNGKVLLQKGYGHKNFETGTLNDPNTVFMIASVTKQFTATVVLKLVEQHQMALTDKLIKYYPGFPEGDKITIYHLLTHTAGLHNFTLDSSFMKDVVNKSGKPLSVSESLIKYKKLDFEPGTNWNYSNSGYQLLGKIIEKVSGMTYYQAVRKYIFQPLEMTHSGFDFEHLKSRDKATGYWTHPSKDKKEEATIIDSAESYSAGCIYSTVGDIYKWHTGLQNYKVVGKALMDQAYKPYLHTYGFGVFIDTLFGQRVIFHTGDTYGFKSQILRVTNDDVCIVLLNNIEDEEMPPIAKDLLAVLYDKPYRLPVKRNVIEVSADILKKYTGTYEMITPHRFSMQILLENGQLLVQPGNQPKDVLYAEKENFFFSKNVDAQLEFMKDGSGNVLKVLVYQDGREAVTLNKVK